MQDFAFKRSSIITTYSDNKEYRFTANFWGQRYALADNEKVLAYLTQKMFETWINADESINPVLLACIITYSHTQSRQRAAAVS